MLTVELRPVESIKPYDRNPRKNDAAVEHVVRSIRTYGWRQPLVVDKDGVIVVGHTRLKAAIRMGLTEVPVHVAHDLTPEQARAYRIADNRSAEIAEWDNSLLTVELGELKDLGLDLSLLGWDASELAEIMAPAGNAGLVDEDDVPEPPDAAVTQPGDLWVLGRHRLLCGDSANPADVDRLLNGAPRASYPASGSASSDSPSGGASGSVAASMVRSSTWRMSVAIPEAVMGPLD